MPLSLIDEREVLLPLPVEDVPVEEDPVDDDPVDPFPVAEPPVEPPVVPVADVPLVVPLVPVELLERELASKRPTTCTCWPTWLVNSLFAPSR